MLTSDNSILALDVGSKRIGVAVANVVARIAHPLTTISNDDKALRAIKDVIVSERAAVLVLGLPRNLSGDSTKQTEAVQVFGKTLEPLLGLPVYWQDEALTSVKAEKELNRRGKDYQKGEIDALAATYILEDFLLEHPEVSA
jgi:putative holliday junction resolvase